MTTLLTVDRASTHHKQMPTVNVHPSFLYVSMIPNPTTMYNIVSSKYMYCPKPIGHKHETTC